METMESMQRKMKSATSLKEVVRTMKAIAASNIVQFENAITAMDDYYQNVRLGLRAYFNDNPQIVTRIGKREKIGREVTGSIILGADQGFVGQFNEAIADYAIEKLKELSGDNIVWVVGERVREYLLESGLKVSGVFEVPSTVEAITPLVGDLLLASETFRIRNENSELYIFYNRHVPDTIYKPDHQRVLPLDETWLQTIYAMPWPTKYLPEVAGDAEQTLLALIHEYLFVLVFRACAQSLATENACRLAATQRADEKIGDLLNELKATSQDIRQNSIDAELFDVVAGFETMVRPRKQ